MVDLERPQWLAAAERARARWPGCKLFLTWTCTQCGRRLTLQEPDVLPDIVQCLDCGCIEPFRAGGFTAVFTV